MTTPAGLLSEATALVADSTAGSRAISAKAAAVLARQALELSVRQRLDRVDPALASASMRSQLDCLQVIAKDTDAAAAAWLAWSNLSSACHHHPYDLAPSTAEIGSLITTVTEIDARLAGTSAAGDAEAEGGA
jgi:hypothetical protein